MRQCKLCGKSYTNKTDYKKVRSKYNPVNTRRAKANLQMVTVAEGTRVKACVSCIRTLNKPERVRNPRKRLTNTERKAKKEEKKKVVKKVVKKAPLKKAAKKAAPSPTKKKVEKKKTTKK